MNGERTASPRKTLVSVVARSGIREYARRRDEALRV